jgi:two-component system, OmpR family, response regulator
MLVLSRGRNDKVVFPTLGISVEILRVAGNKVRLGIEAPQEIPVHRHEVSERIAGIDAAAADAGRHHDPIIKISSGKDATAREMDHAVRNRLNSAALGLHLLHRKLETDDLSDAEATIFKIFNELKAIEEQMSGQPHSPSAPEVSTAVHNETHHRALVVEDNDQERTLMAEWLRVSGFDVDTAADGLQAMVRLTENAPDVILLDMVMPRFDGQRTISAIRNNPDYRGLKLFAVTGTKPGENEVSFGPTGVDRWFTKPIDPQKLIKAMRDELHTEGAYA